MIVKPDERALVYRKDVLVEVLQPGEYHFLGGKTLWKYKVDEPLKPKWPSLHTLLENEALKPHIEVYEVLDHQIGLLFENELFQCVLTPGRHIYWKSSIDRQMKKVDLNQPLSAEDFDRSLLMKSSVREYTVSYAIEAFQKGLLFVDQKFHSILEPGNYFYWKGALSIHVAKVDLRQLQIEVAGQDIMTKDKIGIRLNFFCQYRIVDIVRATVEIQSYTEQFYVLLQLALREYIGALTLDELLERKAEIGPFVVEKIQPTIQAMGLEIVHCGIKDVILPGDIKEILNQVLIAEKKSQANTIMRREETASTRSLLNTAKLMEDNPTLYQLKELEYVERISEKIQSISLSGGTQVLDQLKALFTSEKRT